MSGPEASFAQALDIIARRVRPVAGAGHVPAARAAGRHAAGPLRALRATPPCDNAAVDGYAVAMDDLAGDGETVLPLTGEAAAGRPLAGRAARGGAVVIFTGARIPPPCDTVIAAEMARREAGTVILSPGARRGQNCRRAGEDVQAGDLLAGDGTLIRPPLLGLALASGHRRIRVRRRLRVVLFSSGDELVPPGDPPGEDGIPDANRPMLAALLSRPSIRLTDGGILRDDPGATRERLLRLSRDHDLVLVSGGVSAGGEDHVGRVLETHGEVCFRRVRIKPGRPLSFGFLGDTPLMGLPGNPVAVLVCAFFFLRPLLARLSGAAGLPVPFRFPVTSMSSLDKRPGRREWVRASVYHDAEGRPCARFWPRQGSGIISSLVHSNGLAEFPEDSRGAVPGDSIPFIPMTVQGSGGEGPADP